MIIDYCVKLLCGFCCVHTRLLWCLRAVDMASVCGCSAVHARSLWPPCVVTPASSQLLHPLRSVARPSRAVALTYVSNCLSVRARLHCCLSAVCFGVRVRFLRRPRLLVRPRGVTVVSTFNVYKAWYIVFGDKFSDLNEFELLIKPSIFDTDKYVNYWG